MRVRFAPLILILPLFAFAQSKLETTQTLEPFVVTGKRPSSAEVEGPDGIRTYDESEIEASGAFSLQEFLETLPRGSGEEQLILVDGVPTELSALTPAMVASIEVSYSGAMPAYGAYSRGRIINIRLKQDYDGREVGLQGSGSLHADAWRREVSFSGGSIRGPWRVTYSAEYSRNDAVTADARDFSREQDHRDRGGRDFRLPWGDPAVVQAVTGNLNGVVDAAGNPVPVALVPTNASGVLTPGGFLPGVGPAAGGQRFFNTSPYLYLASPSESLSGQLSLTRTFKKLRLGFGVTQRMNRSDRAGPPPVSAASPQTLVPAALNPFGQDVLVGLVHTGFGPVIQQSEGNNTRLNLSANWQGQAWRINGTLNHSRAHTENDTRDLDPAAFAAALAATSPAARFNPFVGAGSPANATLYPTLALHRTQELTNQGTRFNGTATGPVSQGWGAGPVRVTFNGNANWREDERTSRNLRGVADGTTRHDDASYSLGGNTDVPLLKERPWFHRFDARLGGAYSANSRGGDSQRRGAGLFWVPIRSWTFRVSLNQNTSSPGEQGDDDPESTVETLMDSRRQPAVAENVQIVSRRSASTEASRSDDLQLAASYEPAARPGLEFNVGYTRQRSNRATGNSFKPQDVIDNEALFAGRVVREAPTAADLALGQPGRILVVDTTAAAVASDERSTLDFGIEYQLTPSGRNPAAARGPGRSPGRGMNQGRSQATNRFTLSLDGEVPLESRYEVAAGQSFVSRESGPANRPDWTARAQARWHNRYWNVGLNVRHNAASRLRTIPAITSVGLDVGYRFETAFWGKFGKDLRVRAAVQNLGRDEPPYADTILGYRGGSAVGTMLSLSAKVPW